MERPRKKWGELTIDEINRIKETQCAKCKWFSSGVTGYRGSSTCDYILMNDRRRGCDPRDCVKKGRFELSKKKDKRRKQAWKINVKS